MQFTCQKTESRIQAHTHNIEYLLLFYVNCGYKTASQCYLIRTLPVFFILIITNVSRFRSSPQQGKVTMVIASNVLQSSKWKTYCLAGFQGYIRNYFTTVWKICLLLGAHISPTPLYNLIVPHCPMLILKSFCSVR